MITNYFSEMVNNNAEKPTYQVVNFEGHVLKETKDIAIATLIEQNYLSIGWKVEIKIKK